MGASGYSPPTAPCCFAQGPNAILILPASKGELHSHAPSETQGTAYFVSLIHPVSPKKRMIGTIVIAYGTASNVGVGI